MPRFEYLRYFIDYIFNKVAYHNLTEDKKKCLFQCWNTYFKLACVTIGSYYPQTINYSQFTMSHYGRLIVTRTRHTQKATVKNLQTTYLLNQSDPSTGNFWRSKDNRLLRGQNLGRAERLHLIEPQVSVDENKSRKTMARHGSR